MNIGQRAGYKSIEGMSLNLFSDDELFEIHCATLQVLNETGVRVLAKDAQEIYEGGGCRVDQKTNIVKIPPHVVEDAIRSAPSTFVVGESIRMKTSCSGQVALSPLLILVKGLKLLISRPGKGGKQPSKMLLM